MRLRRGTAVERAGARGSRAEGGGGGEAAEQWGRVSPELHGRAVPLRGAGAQWGGRRRSCRGPGRDEADRLIAGGGKGGGQTIIARQLTKKENKWESQPTTHKWTRTSVYSASLIRVEIIRYSD